MDHPCISYMGPRPDRLAPRQASATAPEAFQPPSPRWCHPRGRETSYLYVSRRRSRGLMPPCLRLNVHIDSRGLSDGRRRALSSYVLWKGIGTHQAHAQGSWPAWPPTASHPAGAAPVQRLQTFPSPRGPPIPGAASPRWQKIVPLILLSWYGPGPDAEAMCKGREMHFVLASQPPNRAPTARV
jgi:hypothetical protein